MQNKFILRIIFVWDERKVFDTEIHVITKYNEGPTTPWKSCTASMEVQFKVGIQNPENTLISGKYTGTSNNIWNGSPWKFGNPINFLELLQASQNTRTYA